MQEIQLIGKGFDIPLCAITAPSACLESRKAINVKGEMRKKDMVKKCLGEEKHDGNTKSAPRKRLYVRSTDVFVSLGARQMPMALSEAQHGLVQVSNVPLSLGKTRQESVNILKPCWVFLVNVATRRLRGV